MVPDAARDERFAASSMVTGPLAIRFYAGDDLRDTLTAYAREKLSGVKIPRRIDFLAELPRHDTGKLYKRLLRDQYWKKAAG